MKNKTKIQFDLNRQFDIVISILESSHNPTYKNDMVKRIKRLKWDTFGEFDKYNKEHAKILQRNKKKDEVTER